MDCLLPGEKAHGFRKLLQVPGLVTSDPGDEVQIAGSGGGLGLGPAPPGHPPTTRGPRRHLLSPAPSLPPDTEVPVPKLPQPSGPHERKSQPATRSPWLSPRGLAFGRPRPSQKARARRAPRKAREAAAVGAADPWRAAAERRRRQRFGRLGAVAGLPARRACALPAGGGEGIRTGGSGCGRNPRRAPPKFSPVNELGARRGALQRAQPGRCLGWERWALGLERARVAPTRRPGEAGAVGSPRAEGCARGVSRNLPLYLGAC